MWFKAKYENEMKNNCSERRLELVTNNRNKEQKEIHISKRGENNGCTQPEILSITKINS